MVSVILLYLSAHYSKMFETPMPHIAADLLEIKGKLKRKKTKNFA